MLGKYETRIKLMGSVSVAGLASVRPALQLMNVSLKRAKLRLTHGSGVIVDSDKR